MRAWLYLAAALLAGALRAAPPARPFPQHTAYAAGAVPLAIPAAELDAATARAYAAWRHDYLTEAHLPGQKYVRYHLDDRPEATTVSEGQGYGMVISAYLGPQEDFDALFRYFRAHPSSQQPGLMSWIQVKGDRDVKGDDDSASDGDLDIAYALLLAERQWGRAGAIDYHAEALRVIAAIKAGEMNPAAATVKLGDWVDDEKQSRDIRLSDLMPDHFRSFAQATGDPLWTKAVDRAYACLDFLQTHYAPNTGLVPDFAIGAQAGQPIPAPKKYLESKNDGQYSYNACRVPWRVGVDALLTGDPRARAVLERMNRFIARAAVGAPAAISAGYHLETGKPIDAEDRSLAFTAPFGVAAVAAPGDPAWAERLVRQLMEKPGKDEDSYGRSIAVLCLIAISGNWWSPAS